MSHVSEASLVRELHLANNAILRIIENALDSHEDREPLDQDYATAIRDILVRESNVIEQGINDGIFPAGTFVYLRQMQTKIKTWLKKSDAFALKEWHLHSWCWNEVPRTLGHVEQIIQWSREMGTPELSEADRETDLPDSGDHFAEIRQVAKESLTGISQKIVLAACERGGSIPLTDLASLVEWNDGDRIDGRFQSRKTAINKVFKKEGSAWRIGRRNNSVVLRKIS